MVKCTLNPNCAEILSHLVHAKGGGGSYMTPPPLTSGYSGQKGQITTQMVKFWKKPTLNDFFY